MSSPQWTDAQLWALADEICRGVNEPVEKSAPPTLLPGAGPNVFQLPRRGERRIPTSEVSKK